MILDARFGTLRVTLPRNGQLIANILLEGAKINVKLNANQTIEVQGKVGLLNGGSSYVELRSFKT